MRKGKREGEKTKGSRGGEERRRRGGEGEKEKK
jgi:hypothetical protein